MNFEPFLVGFDNLRNVNMVKILSDYTIHDN